MTKKEVVERLVYDSDAISFLIAEKYRDSTVSIPDSLVEMIVNDYVSTKRELVLNGAVVEEEGLGSVKAISRRVPKHFSKLQFTMKVDTEIDNEVREMMIDKAIESEDFRNTLGLELPEIEEEEVK